MKKMIVCLGLAWKLVLAMSLTAYGQDREPWTGHSAHELIQPSQKDLAAPHISAASLPVDVSRNCAYDPKGDVYSGNSANTVDLAIVCGWQNGSSAVIQLTDTVAADIYGYVCLDTDRNPETGRRFRIYRIGLKGIGCDYELDLFEITESGVVYITDISRQIIGSFPAKMDGNVLKLEIPLSIVKDNGNMNVAVIVGDKYGPTDWLDVPYTQQTQGYNTWLSIFVAETAIYPAGGKFIEGRPFQIDIFSNAAPGVSVSRIRAFLNDRELFPDAFRGDRLPTSIAFGISNSLSVGRRNKFLVLMETSDGIFADEAEFEIVPPWNEAVPTRSQPPVPASTPSATPPSLPPFPPLPAG